MIKLRTLFLIMHIEYKELIYNETSFKLRLSITNFYFLIARGNTSTKSLYYSLQNFGLIFLPN